MINERINAEYAFSALLDQFRLPFGNEESCFELLRGHTKVPSACKPNGFVKTFIRKRFLGAPVIALVKPRDNGGNTGRRFLPVIPFFPLVAVSWLSMLKTVVKAAVCHADAKHSTGSTLKYSTCDANPCPAFRTTSGVARRREEERRASRRGSARAWKRRARKSRTFFPAVTALARVIS